MQRRDKNHRIIWITIAVDKMKIISKCSIGVCRFTSMCWWRRDRAITMHRPSDTYDTCWLRNWHRHWLVVRSCLGSTIAMLCCTALQATASRSCNEYRSTQLRSFSKHQDDPTVACCWGCYTGCQFSRGSSTKWLCWHSKSAAPRCHHTCDS